MNNWNTSILATWATYKNIPRLFLFFLPCFCSVRIGWCEQHQLVCSGCCPDGQWGDSGCIAATWRQPCCCGRTGKNSSPLCCLWGVPEFHVPKRLAFHSHWLVFIFNSGLAIWYKDFSVCIVSELIQMPCHNFVMKYRYHHLMTEISYVQYSLTLKKPLILWILKY